MPYTLSKPALLPLALAAGLLFALASAFAQAPPSSASAPFPSFPDLTSMDVKAPDFPKPGAHVSGTTWIDSSPLTMADLRGKVVLIDFWEYTCINCIRTFAQDKLWYSRYHKDGFEIVGVHDPEFDIAYQIPNVEAAVKRFGLPYPIVADDWFTIWKSFQSNAWPNRFLIDANGVIRYNRVGEGADHSFEEAIRYLLVQAHPGLKFPPDEHVWTEIDDGAPGCGGAPTREMFTGPMYGNDDLANPHPYHPGQTEKYKMPANIRDGYAGISGRWQTDQNGMIYEGSAQDPGPRADRMRMRYHAAELYSVINVWRGKPESLYILQDGAWLTKQTAGVDVKFDSQGRSYIPVDAPRMYYLVVNPKMSAHVVDLIPTAPGIVIDSFTFGNDCQRNFPHL